MDASIVDKDLIERINKGEEKAFEVLYNSYLQPWSRRLLLLCRLEVLIPSWLGN